MSRSTEQSSPHPSPGHLPPNAREGSATAIPAQLYLRALAALYDLLPLLGIWFGAGLLALLVTGGALDPHRAAHKFIVQALVLMLTATYFILSWARGGQTIGMRAWRLRVVSADGSPLPAARALLRFLIALISLAALGAGFWWTLLDPHHRTWHDRAAQSLVLRVNVRPSAARHNA
jgi:uncharacterized RDD family membrane protein YckC